MIVWLEAWYKSACPLLVHDFIFSISFYLFKYNKTPKYLMSLIAEGDGDDHYKWKKLVHHHRPLLPFLEPFDQNVFLQCSSIFFSSSLFYLTWQSDQSAQGGWIWLVREGLKSLQMKTMKTSLKCQR